MRIHPILDFIGGPLLAALFGVLSAAESARPLRSRVASRAGRLAVNLPMGAAAALVVRLVVVPAMTWTARRSRRAPIAASGPARTLLAFLLLDYTIYLWHRANHRIPFLYRFHEVHHTDPDLDASTALRFHAGELALSALFRVAQALLVGASPRLLLAYEVVMQAATVFHHANLRLPARVERALVLVLVTPRMHGVHHSVEEREQSSNWSVIFSFWDRLHGSFISPFPERAVTIGVASVTDGAALDLVQLLKRPLEARGS